MEDVADAMHGTPKHLSFDRIRRLQAIGPKLTKHAIDSASHLDGEAVECRRRQDNVGRNSCCRQGTGVD